MVQKSSSFSLPLFLLLLFLATAAGTLIFSASLSKARKESPLAQACGGANILSQSGSFEPQATGAIWLGQAVSPPVEPYAVSEDAEALAANQVLGQTSEEKWIEVDLSTQTVRAHEGDKVVYEFLTSSGKFAPTPTGEFEIWYKVRYTKMEGGEKGTNRYYYLPNVPFTMFFYGPFGLHGTYWHNNFGQPMSHGCVNLSIANAEKLFHWAGPFLPESQSAIRASDDNPGTRVVVHGRAPRT